LRELLQKRLGGVLVRMDEQLSVSSFSNQSLGPFGRGDGMSMYTAA